MRDYLLTVFRELSRLPGAEELLGPARNPAWRLSPSEGMARRLLDLFQVAGADGVGLRWAFGGDDTRFLGDLYQDLSEAVRKRLALLQTPEFVERFILGLTLDPALKEFGLPGLRVIDPTCGSGHFLLGAYDRLFDAHLAAAPGADRRQHALAALEQVYGVDINPYAVAIARFRLTLSFLAKAGITKLAEAPRLPLTLVVADSLLHGAKGVTGRLAEAADDKAGWHDELFTLEDEAGAKRVLGQGYHVVVGNPPYITCKDAALRDEYRKLYRSCYREYALAAPFTEAFFNLAASGGYIGLINANSFMKREFGKKLVEEVLPKLDLTHVIDSSGAYIPGHGTPTVILAGRNRGPSSRTLRAVLGKRGEPTTPKDPEKGKVWSPIVEHLGEPGYEGEFVSVVEMERDRLAKHPWSLGGGGAAELKSKLEERAERRLDDVVELIGFGAATSGRARNPANVNRLVAEVAKKRDAASLARAGEVESLLAARSSFYAGQPPRLQTARAVQELLAALQDSEPAALVKALAGAKVATSLDAMLRHLTGAGAVVAALGNEMAFGSFHALRGRAEPEAGQVLEEVRKALEGDELHLALGPKLEELGRRALEVIAPKLAPERQPERPMTGVIATGSARSLAELDAQRATMADALARSPGAALSLTWTVTEP